VAKGNHKSKRLSEAEVRECLSKDTSIVCPIDNRTFRDAVKTLFCGTAYWEDSFQTDELEKDSICLNCASKIALLASHVS
jgi:protein MPE1